MKTLALRSKGNLPMKFLLLLIPLLGVLQQTDAQVTVLGNADDVLKKDLSEISIIKTQTVLQNHLTLASDTAGFEQTEVIKEAEPFISYGFDVKTLQNVFPEAVIEDEDGNYSIDYYMLIPIMVKIIQEQEIRIKELEKLISDKN